MNVTWFEMRFKYRDQRLSAKMSKEDLEDGNNF